MNDAGREYAHALFSLAMETNRSAEGAHMEVDIHDGLDIVKQVFRENPDYRKFLRSPAIPKSKRIKALKDAFEESVTEYVLSFLCILCENGHMDLLNDCIAEYEKIFDESQNISYAKAISAVELTDEEKERLVGSLEKKSHKKVLISYEVDPSILGGLIVRMDGKIMDGSLKNRLQTMKEVMSE